VPSNSKRLTRAELASYEAKRDLAADLLQSVLQMKAGKVQVVTSPVIEARRKTGLSQSQFAALLGVSVRTLQGWEQGRKQPSGAARTLLRTDTSGNRRLTAQASTAASRRCPIPRRRCPLDTTRPRISQREPTSSSRCSAP